MCSASPKTTENDTLFSYFQLIKINLHTEVVQ